MQTISWSADRDGCFAGRLSVPAVRHLTNAIHAKADGDRVGKQVISTTQHVHLDEFACFDDRFSG